MSTGPGSTSGSKIMGAPAPVRHEDRGHAPHPHPYHHRIPPYGSPPTQSPRSRSYYHEGAPRDAASATTPKSAHISERYWDYSRQPPPPQSPRGHLPPPPGHHHVSHAPPPPSHHSYPHHAPMDVATHAQSQSSRHPAHYRPPPPMAPTTPSQHSPYPYPPRSSLSHYDEPYYSPRRIHDDPASLSAPAGHETYRGRPWIPPSASYPPPPHHYQQGHYSHNPPPPPPHPPQSHLHSHPGGTPSYPPVMPSPRDGKSHLPSPHTSQHHYPYHAPQGPPPSQRPSNAPPTPSYAQHPHAQIQPQHHKNVHHHSHAHPHSQSSKNPPPQFTQDSNEKPASPSPHSQSLQPHSHSPHPSTDPSRSSQSVPSTMPRPPHTSRAPSTAPRTTTVGPPPPKKEFSPSKGGAFQPYHRLRSRDPSMGLVHPHDHSHPPPTAPPANAGGPNHPSRASREAQPPSGGHFSIPNLKSKQNQNRECMVIDLNDDDDDGNGNGDDKKDRFEDAKERKLGVNSPISRGGIPADRMDNADLGKEESKATKQDMASKACSDPELQSDAAKEINDTKKPVDLDIATDRNAADSDGNAMEEKVSEAGFSNGVDASESLSKGKLEGSVIEAPNGKATEQSPQDENPATEDIRDDENEQKSPPSITQHNYRREEPMPSSSTSTHPDKQSSKSPTSVDKRVHREDASTVGKRKQPAPISTMGPPIASKRPRQGNDSIGMDDATPKNYNGTRGPGIGSTARGPNPRIPHNASALINKRYRVADAEEYESSACASKFKTGYHPHHHYHPDYHRLPPPRRYGHDMDERQYEAQLRVPSLDSLEDRQDKSHGRFDDGRGDYDDRRYDHQSFSPSNQHPSDRSYDDYNHEHRFRRRTYSESSSIQMNRGPEDRRDSYEDLRQLNPAFSTSHDAVSLQQNNSLTEYPEPASIYATNKSMSWEVPPALSAICSFGELKNDLTSSPSLPRYSPTDGRLGGSGSDRRSARDANGVYVNEDDVEDDELPPIPGARADVAFPPVRKPFLEQRPTNQPFNGPPLRDSYDGRHHHHPDWPYDHPRDRYPPSHYPPRDRSLPHHPSRYPDVRYNDMRGHYPPPPHENERRYRDELRSTYDHRRDYDRRYDRTRDVRDLDRHPSSRHRDPYSSPSFQQHERYEQDGHHRHLKPWHSPPSASRRDHYLSYPHDTPGGTDSYSYSAESREHMNYPSRSMDDLEEATSFSLALRPSFSWEAPLPKSPRRDEVVEGNADDGDSRIIQLKDQRKLMNSLAIRNEIRTLGNLNNPSGLILLLAMPQDRHCLSETLCTIRSNVEVFTATEEDVNAPAPGRKRPVRVGQVGLRCVYCRSHRTDRVKRATCFPSAISRIYRAVIDMKLDHFSNCRYVPPGLKTRLDELQAGSSRSTGMTVQYFVKSAKELGMRDAGDDGVFIDLKRVGQPLDYRRDEVTHPERHQAPQIASAHREIIPRVPSSKVLSSSQERPHQVDRPFDDDEDPGPDVKKYHGKVLLALPDDESFLSPLRCFLRENVCVFSATERDIAVRTPTTFSVRVGQVGVGCVHCLGLPPKSRSNRAVCFPFTVARIYQSVADIQRFHLGECRMMPPEVRAKFLQLQSESAKGSKGLATRTYWIDSAKKLGLADGPTGMYFSRDPSMPPPPSDGKSLDILAQVATNVKTKCKPLVTPEDKPTIAEFLYVVMDQLQPCRFTDADRNKRRSKNLGSIGVECKHCAGKIDGRKFFWSSVSAAESNFVSVHSHMMDCKYIPDDFKAELARLKSLRREQTSKLKTGSQKSFFTRVWNRLHNIEDEPEAVAKQKKKGENSGKSVKKSKSPKNSSKPPPSVAHGQPKTQGTKIATSSDRDKSNTNSTINQAADLDSVELKTGSSSDSIHHDDIRALLESKSTLTSAASGDDLTTKALEAPESLDIEINEGARNHIEAGRGSDSISRAAMDIASKSSLGSVAVNMSAVSFRSHDDRRDVKNEEDEQIEKSSVAV